MLAKQVATTSRNFLSMCRCFMGVAVTNRCMEKNLSETKRGGLCAGLIGKFTLRSKAFRERTSKIRQR